MNQAREQERGAGRSAGAEDARQEYADAVLALVESIPPGRAMTYGLVAEIVAETLGRGGPRQVGQVLATSDGDGPSGEGLPWWRVVNAAGSPPAHHLSTALANLRAEGCPLRPGGERVDLRRAVWFPEPAPER
ncbi:MGMT family protein [Oerskovia jenensis]|uniref:Alkylated DNA nucleotide flippase Atl1 n=1 Tax=Oerskovia jenensis TaxID=162169 RepID=A0ABS2LC44_9CELL|nr:MGMT family protein [Oerskovia jenensis]MBM7477907.1 alkylated DNA nucleotide flippase Atl1 [Oerskovia jenensis]